MLDVDCDIVAGDWDDGVDWAGISERAIAAALSAAGFNPAGQGSVVEVAVRLTGDDEIQRLNRDYRGKDRPTNILSFPMQAPDDLPALMNDGQMDVLLGDLALAAGIVAAEAQEKGIPLPDHVTHLLVHGTLHLLGHDHGDDATAHAMETLETRILAGLGVADPYVDVLTGADERQ